MIKNVKKIIQSDDNTKFNYELTKKDNTVWSVPIDEANTDYQAILQWVADGNTIQEAD